MKMRMKYQSKAAKYICILQALKPVTTLGETTSEKRSSPFFRVKQRSTKTATKGIVYDYLVCQHVHAITYISIFDN